MRSKHLCAVVLVALMAGGIGTANASYFLHFTGFLYGTGQAVSVNVEGVNHTNIGLGPVTGWRAQTATPTPAEKIWFEQPLYCVDIYHSFTWSDSWWADPILVPPDQTPPPYNTAEGAWIYQTYGTGNLTATQAKGVQLALWETSHEDDWRSNYHLGDESWASGGKFYITGGSVAAAQTYATGVLDLLYNNNPNSLGETATYWKPLSNRTDGYQGMLGDNEVPEPTTLALGGAALVMAGLGWWRRKKSA